MDSITLRPLSATDGMRNELPNQQQVILTRCDKLKQFKGWDTISPYVKRLEEVLQWSAAGLFDIDRLSYEELRDILEPSNLQDPREIVLCDCDFPAELREDILSLLRAIYSHVHDDIEFLCKRRLLSSALNHKRNNIQANACMDCVKKMDRSCAKVAAESNNVTTGNKWQVKNDHPLQNESSEELNVGERYKRDMKDLQDALSKETKRDEDIDTACRFVTEEIQKLNSKIDEMSETRASQNGSRNVTNPVSNPSSKRRGGNGSSNRANMNS
jgi:hypothetical protein